MRKELCLRVVSVGKNSVFWYGELHFSVNRSISKKNKCKKNKSDVFDNLKIPMLCAFNIINNYYF